MTSEEIHSRLQSIFRDVFDDAAIVITRATHSGDIPDWDSLAQINLVVAIEKEFGITMSLQDLATLTNVGDMNDLIRAKVA
ncbi:MAG: acyl carrier protein [Burkholderiales bacterium]